MKKSDYKIEFDSVSYNNLYFRVMRKKRYYIFNIFGYKISFFSKWVSVSDAMPLELAKEALREIHEWIDDGGK